MMPKKLLHIIKYKSVYICKQKICLTLNLAFSIINMLFTQSYIDEYHSHYLCKTENTNYANTVYTKVTLHQSVLWARTEAVTCERVSYLVLTVWS